MVLVDSKHYEYGLAVVFKGSSAAAWQDDLDDNVERIRRALAI
jgi:hypothetical protein